MAVYTRQFFAGLLSATNLAIVTVPAGMVWILRDLELGDRSGTASNITVFLVHSAGIVAPIINALMPNPYGTAHWAGRVAMNAGDGLGLGSGTWPVGLIATGYEFTLP